jgi:uncharacterized protein (DUF2141 family)
MKHTGILAMLCLCIFLSFSLEKSVLTIDIENIRSQKGVIWLALYTKPEQYPDRPVKKLEVKKDSLAKGVLHVEINDMEPGRYALCFLDDENKSGEMEYNGIGIPLEGFGFANNVKPVLQRPGFDRINVKILPGNNHITLTTRYMCK